MHVIKLDINVARVLNLSEIPKIAIIGKLKININKRQKAVDTLKY
jgi:hypothetical protein